MSEHDQAPRANPSQAGGTGRGPAQQPDVAPSGQASYDAHIAELEADAAYVEAVGVMLDRIHGQMITADMGAEVTGEVTTAQERCSAAAGAVRSFREAARTANEGVKHARMDAGGQAARNDYLTSGR